MKPHYLNASIWVQKSHSGWTVKVYWSSYLKHKTKYLVLVEFAFYLFFIIVYFQVISDVLLQAEQFKIQLYFPVCIQKINENSFFFFNNFAVLGICTFPIFPLVPFLFLT